MELNGQKCKVIKFHKTSANTSFFYQIKGNPLECVAGHLGCLDLSKAVLSSLWISPPSKHYTLPMFVHTLNMPHQYGACHIHRLESFQRKFCRYLNYKFFTDRQFYYSNACKELNITSLSCRRKQRDFKLIHKIVNSTVDSPYLLSKIGLHVPSRNTHTLSTFHQQINRTNYSSHSFIPRTLRLCNGLRDADFFGPNEPFVRFNTGLSL